MTVDAKIALIMEGPRLAEVVTGQGFREFLDLDVPGGDV